MATTLAIVHLYLLRHGQSHVNLTDLTATHRDSPLTDTGREQAQRAAEYISAEIEPDAIYASTVARAAETATIVASECKRTVQSDDRLREIGTSYPDGRPIPEEKLSPYFPDVWGTLRPYQPVTKDGESWMHFRSRVGSFVEMLVPARDRFGDPELAEQLGDTKVLIVCHAGVIEAIFEYVFEKGPWSVVAVQTNNAGITHLQYRPIPHFPDWWLHSHNNVGHLTKSLLT